LWPILLDHFTSLTEAVTLTFELTVTDDDGSKGKDSIDVLVKPLPIPAIVNISEQAVSLNRWEDQIQLSVTSVTDAQGNTINNADITWESNNTAIASVDNGLIKSGKQGDATITVTATNEYGSATGEAVISVKLQRNSACKIPSKPNRGSVAAATTYTEVESNTRSQGFIRSYSIDLNHDGKDDMFWIDTFFNLNTLEQPSTPYIWLSQGDGNFTNATDTYLPDGLTTADMPRQLFSADIDGDNDTDYVVLQTGYDPGGLLGLDCGNVECPGAPNLLITMGDDGKLRDTAPTSFTPYDTNGFTHAGGIADVDCDGDIDILEGQLPNELASAPNRLQINNGNGKFTADENAFPAMFTNIGFYGGAFCDLDADGDPDVYAGKNGVYEGAGAADIIFTNDGFGKFRLLSGKRFDESRLGADNQLPADTRCFDFDGDGLNDILKPNETSDLQVAFELLHNNGDMTFTDVTDAMLQNTPPIQGGYRPFIVDLNNDSWPDILAPGSGDYLRIYWNNGSGFTEFRFPPETAIGTRGASVTYGDFDGDNDIDIHISRSEYKSILLKAN